MQDQLSEFTTKKNLASLLVLAILVLAIPLGVNLVRQQQQLKSKAAGEQVIFASPGIDQRTGPNGSPVTVAVAQTIGLNLGLPTGWSYTVASPTPTPTPPTIVYAELVRYYSFGNTDNWSTTSLQNTLYPSPPASGYGKSESQGYILAYDDGLGDVAPLYDCLGNNSNKQGDHSEEVGACSSGTQTQIGYIYKNPQTTNSTAIHHCLDRSNGDSFLFKGTACNVKYDDNGLIGYSLNSIPSSTTPPSGSKPPKPAVSTDNACLKSGNAINVVISWDPQAGVNAVDSSDVSNFSHFWHKVGLESSVTSVTAPEGFTQFNGETTPLIYKPGSTYHTRLWNGKWSDVNSFLIPSDLNNCQ